MEDIDTAENVASAEQKVPSTRRDRVARWLVGSGITLAVSGAALAEVHPDHSLPLLGAAAFGFCANVAGAIYGDPWRRPESHITVDSPTTAETVETELGPLSAAPAQSAKQ